MKPYYITTPIYYPSNNLHLGHTYTTIVADVLKRIKKAQGYDVFFTTGTDEHGQKIKEAAEKAGKEPLEFVTEIVDSAKDLWKALDIDYDAFVRTTDPQHEKNVQAVFKKLHDQGDIYKGVYQGHYCTPCEAFWTESQLEDGKCPDCGREVQYREEESYFFRLSKYSDRVKEFLLENPDFLQPESRKKEMINNFLDKGLEDLSVSRKNLTWGVPVPTDPDHVIYVWIDALTCYLTGIGYGVDQEKFTNYWPAEVHLLGKEIVRFHAIIWVALLMALDLPLPKKEFAHGWILFDDTKMSKSIGNVVYPEPIIERYGVDALKYFVMREFSFGSDGSFTYNKLIQRLNSDLANDLGNLVSRTIQMVVKYKDGVVPEAKDKEEVDQELISMASMVKDRVEKAVDNFDFSQALESIWELIRRTNKYIDETTPWILGREENYQRLDTVLYNLVDSIRIISQMIQPFMPATAKEINKQLGIEDMEWEAASEFGLYQPGTKVQRGDNLFQRLDLEEEIQAITAANEEWVRSRVQKTSLVQEEQEEDQGKAPVTLDGFDALDLRLVEVVDCDYHPNADKLLVFQVKIGSEQRQIVSGVRKFYEPKDLIGKKLIAITNIPSVKIRGVESKGMLLSAAQGDKLSLLTTLGDMESGAQIG